MSQFQVFLRVLVLVLALWAQGSLQAQRIKLLQLEQKGVPREGYFGLTNSSGDQVYTDFTTSVTTIITANGHWYLNGFDDAFGSTTISPGETVSFTGNDGSFRGIVAGLASSGSNVLFIDGTALQWNLGANGSYTTIGNVQGSSESVNFVGAGIASTSRSSNTITITATEVDGSTSNELQTIAVTGTTTGITTLSNSGGSMTIAAAGINSIGVSGSTITITATEVDGSITNEIDEWQLGANASYTTISDGESVNFVGAGIASTSRSTNTITITATEVDGSVSNELQTIAVTGTTTGITTLSNSGGSMTIAAAGINSIGVSGSTITITATEVDGSTSNEIQGLDFFNASSPVTLYADGSADGVMFVQGSGITLSMATDQLTITATDVSASNELQTIAVTGTTTGITTLSNSGGSMTIAAAGINSIGVSGSTITITATEVDGSVSNELQTIAVTGTTTGITTLSNSGGSMTIAAAGINSIGVSGSTITITATEVDGSITNEIDEWQLGANASYTTISNGESVDFVGASGVTTSRSGNTITITGSSSLSGSGTTNYVTKWTSSTTLGNSAIQDNGTTVSIGGSLDASYELFIADGHVKIGDAAGELNKIYFGDGTFVFVGEGGADDRLYLQGTTMSINIGGSLGTSGYVLTSNGTTASWQPASAAYSWELGANASYTTISDGESVNFVGAGIASTSRSTNTITITATEVDGSVSNELQTIAVTGTTTGITTLSNSGGSMTIAAGGINSIGVSGSTITITATEVDGSTSNELQNLTFTGTGPFTLDISSGTDVTFTEGLNIDITRSTNDLSFKATPAGSNTYVQYNSSGSFGASANLVWTGTKLSVTGGISASGYYYDSNDDPPLTGQVLAGTATGTQWTTLYPDGDGDNTNELDVWNLGANASYTSISHLDNVNFVGAGIATTSRSSRTITITATEVDGSVSNELQTIAVTGTTTGITTLSNSGGSMTIAAGGINSIGVSGSTITITATEVDGSTSNELQNLTFTGASSPYTLDISSGTDVTFTEGNNIDLSRSTNQLTIAQPAFTDLATGFTNQYVIYVDASATPTASSDFFYNGSRLNIPYLTLTSDPGVSGGEIYSLARRSSDGYVMLTRKNTGALVTESGTTTLQPSYPYQHLTGSGGIYTLPSGGSSEGWMFILFNESGGDIYIRRPSGGYINGSTSDYTMTTGTIVIFIEHDTALSNWFTIAQ